MAWSGLRTTQHNFVNPSLGKARLAQGTCRTPSLLVMTAVSAAAPVYGQSHDTHRDLLAETMARMAKVSIQQPS